MRSTRSSLVTVAVAVAICVLIAPLVIRGGFRYYALRRVIKLPEARERLAVQPRRRTLAALPRVHPINLGYASFDTGMTNLISIEAISSGASVLLTNSDLRVVFLPPFCPEKSMDLPSASARVSANEARAHARKLEMEADQVAAEMRMEETQLLPFSKVLFMGNDDFLLYAIRLTLKAGNRWSSREVQFFEGPDAKGIVRIGKASNDRRFASVFLASRDGTKAVGFQMTIPRATSNDISTSLDPILRSFHFTTDTVDNRDTIMALIRGAGILRRDGTQDGSAFRSQPNGSETNRTPSAAGFRR